MLEGLPARRCTALAHAPRCSRDSCSKAACACSSSRGESSIAGKPATAGKGRSMTLPLTPSTAPNCKLVHPGAYSKESAKPRKCCYNARPKSACAHVTLHYWAGRPAKKATWPHAHPSCLHNCKVRWAHLRFRAKGGRGQYCRHLLLNFGRHPLPWWVAPRRNNRQLRHAQLLHGEAGEASDLVAHLAPKL